jgi:hypothetical protein
VISLQVGDCWLWSLIIFLIQRFVSAMLGPHSLMGGVGGFPPHNYVTRGVQGGGGTIFVAPPLAGDSGASAPEVKYWEKLPCKIL